MAVVHDARFLAQHDALAWPALDRRFVELHGQLEIFDPADVLENLARGVEPVDAVLKVIPGLHGGSIILERIGMFLPADRKLCQ